MISLPPLPDRPLLWGKGWFSSSQPRALQRSWQACLSVYGMCTSACGCVRVAEAPCIKLNHMTWASPQSAQTLCVHLTHRHVSLLKNYCSFNGAPCSLREEFVIRRERSSLPFFFIPPATSLASNSVLGTLSFVLITSFILQILQFWVVLLQNSAPLTMQHHQHLLSSPSPCNINHQSTCCVWLPWSNATL